MKKVMKTVSEPSSSCKHNWKYSYYSGQTIGFRCTKCEQEKERPTTASEKYLIREDMKKKDDTHKIYHKFVKKFQDVIGNYKLHGYDLICSVEKWAKRYPTVTIVSCDDNYFMGSDLVFIPHEELNNYTGVTVIFIPQRGNEPSEFFLYPGHAVELLKTMKNIVSASKNIKNKEWSPIK